MYPSKGGNSYGQQPYAAQQAYGQIPGTGYPGNPVVPDGGGLSARQSMMGAGQEADMGGYRGHTSQVPQYGGPYAAVYGSAAMSSAQQVGGGSGKGAVSSGLQGRTGYPSALAESSKFSAGALGSSLGMSSDDYLSASNRGYNQKGDQFSALKNSDYTSMDRREYGEHQGSYIGRELQGDSARRYSDSVALSHQHQLQSEMHDRMDQTSLLRQQQMLKAQSLQSGSDMRQADYLAARAAPIHTGSQELSSYGGRMDADPRSLSILSGTQYGGQHAASILGGAPRRNVDDLIYAQGSSAAGYGVGLPPGRDYVAGKGLRGPSLESDYQGSLRGHPSLGLSMIDDRKDDRSAFRRELEIRDDERRRELIREREKERERDERERDRERERERERERQRDRERDRERERERDRLRERRDKERERDRKRGSDSKRERTPPRTTRDRQGSSLTRDERPLRRVTPRREAAHRHHSPVKEKKREYICKVYPFCLVDTQRDYLSLNKRYPRLSISPDFSKVVFNWPKEKLNLSLHTPVSFEHDFVEVDKTVEKGSIPLVDESSKSKCGSTVWNAKVILMSGISSDALEELSSEKTSDKRIIHLNNILKFAILRKDHSFMSIGGPWDVTVDGGDPSVDDSSLIQTALRYLKDLTQLDLQKCLHWNRFLEIHYDRVDKDGLFSHKEITVLFLPDLSVCLPSLELWRSQWFAHMKDVAERERQLASKKKKSSEKKEAVQGERSHGKTEKDNISAKKVKAEADAVKDEKVDKMDLEGPSIEKKSDTKKADQSKDDISEAKKNISEQKGKGPILDEKLIEKKVEGAVGSEYKADEKEVNDRASDPTVEIKQPTKKKIVKKKVIGKKAAVEDTITKPVEKMDVKDGGDNQGKKEAAVQEDGSSANPVNVKTFVRKKIIKKVPAGKPAMKEDKVPGISDVQTEKKPEKENELEEDRKKEQKETEGTAPVPGTGVKTTGKKKVIRRVIKRKVSGREEKDANATNKKSVEKDDTVTLPEASKGEDIKDRVGKKDKELDVVNDSVIKITEDSKTLAVEKESTSEKKMDGKKDKKESKSDDNISMEEKGGSKSGIEPENGRKEDSRKDSHDGKDKVKDENQTKAKDAKIDSKSKSHKEVKEKGIPEEPPRHPGLFLQTKQPKDSKVRIRSMSLSLDGLMDYNDKDVGESTFELSLFAESLNEMLQYEMGCRILSFLEKLRKRFIVQRNLRKRQREENPEKESEKEKASAKRPKNNDDSPVENESLKSETQDASNIKHDEKMAEDRPGAGPVDSKTENKTEDDIEDEEEDPEEIIEDEEDQEMDDAAPSEDGVQEDGSADETGAADPQKSATTEDDKDKGSASERSSDKAAKSDGKSEMEKEDNRTVSEKSDSVNEVVVDKELFQAFRFFDQNQVGYIRVEDLRCIIHNLGKFLPYRDVKEMVQSALFESNSARDNRVFYKKLVRLADI